VEVGEADAELGQQVSGDRNPGRVSVLRVRVSPATLQHRLRERGLERDAYKLAHWDEYWATQDGQACAWTGARLSELSNDSDEAEFPLDRRSTRALQSTRRSACPEATA
jgi:hypothetical protein